MDIVDETGNVVVNGMPESEIGNRNSFGSRFGPSGHLNDLKEGSYSARVRATLKKNASEENAQYLEFPLVIDKTAPEIRQEKKVINGRKILELSASDSCALDGIVVLGNGTGNPVGSSRPLQNKGGPYQKGLFKIGFEDNKGGKILLPVYSGLWFVGQPSWYAILDGC